VKLDGEQIVLDTNILVHWLRGKAAGERLSADYDLGRRRPRAIVPVVVFSCCVLVQAATTPAVAHPSQVGSARTLF
jgi:hypothetical protein